MDAPPRDAVPTAFPAPSRTATAEILSTRTSAMSLLFSDKILLTVSQNGRLNHWIHVPLSSPPTTQQTGSSRGTGAPTGEDEDGGGALPLLPSSCITATTILGGTVPALDTLGQTLAASVASAVQGRDRDEGRLLVLGLGLERGMQAVGPAEFADLVGLCLDVL